MLLLYSSLRLRTSYAVLEVREHGLTTLALMIATTTLPRPFAWLAQLERAVFQTALALRAKGHLEMVLKVAPTTKKQCWQLRMPLRRL